MTKVLILGPFEDLQTGIYIMEAFQKVSSDIVAVDIRRIVTEVGGNKESQDTILTEIESMNIEPDLILVLKGAEMTPETLERIQNTYKKAKIINWLFDKYVGSIPVWENKEYIEFIKRFDYFFCSLKGVVDKLRSMGLNNVFFLPEACSPDYNGETYMNFFQKQKYGEDISFVGTLGLTKFHPTRIPILKRIVNEGYKLKIWGNVACDWKLIPKELKVCHTGEEAININHSKVVQSSLINLGIDQDSELDLGQSARIYRVMAAGGFYMCPYIKGIEKMFKINMFPNDNKSITSDLELVVFYDLDDMVEKLDYLLEHDELRKQIALNGQKLVLEKHKFEDRINELIKIVEIK